MTGITRKQALAAGLAAYVMGGAFPPYFSLLKAATPLEILGHRIVWSFAAVLITLVATRSDWAWLRTGVFTRRTFGWLAAATVLIGANWLIYIWAVNDGHVVEASVGYFINPLVSVLLGVVFFGEKLGRGGRIGGTIALLGVVIISWGHWSTLWISLLLALSFGGYGAVKKRAHLTPLQGLLVESGLLLPFAIIYLVWLGTQGQGQFGTAPGITLLLMSSGIVTALPLYLFALAATRLPLGVVGILQYVTPTMQFLFGIFLFKEAVALSYWIGVIAIWIGSVIYLTLTLRDSKAPEVLPGDA